MRLRIRKTNHDATVPAYGSDQASGLDLAAAAECILQPGQIARIPTGIAVEIPIGCEGQVRPRSGLSSRGIVAILGTVDADYRGEIHVLLENRSDGPCTIFPGDRIAQLVIAPVARVDLEVVEELSETERGEGGFGSTGIQSIPDMGPVRVDVGLVPPMDPGGER